MTEDFDDDWFSISVEDCRTESVKDNIDCEPNAGAWSWLSVDGLEEGTVEKRLLDLGDCMLDSWFEDSCGELSGIGGGGGGA